jgi:hypothetical protein
MPIVTISIALRAGSAGKQGSRQITLTLGIAVHDHLIVGKDGHASLKALKLM